MGPTDVKVRSIARSLRVWSVGAVLISVGALAGLIALDDPSASRASAKAPSANSGHAASYARIIDGDTLELNDQRIRLWGIDAPEAGQVCQGHDGRTYECGRDAAAVLDQLTRGRRVECDTREKDRYQRAVAVCRTDAGEINAAMVRRGWAVDYTKYSGGRHRSDEAAAKAEGLGVWSGRFELPSEWRQGPRR